MMRAVDPLLETVKKYWDYDALRPLQREAMTAALEGRDSRVDYREMGRLKKEFPEASIHAFTATATPRVREDIVEQLGLKDPQVLVGDFFRPNLSYSCVKRSDAEEDVVEEVKKRSGQAGI